MRAPGPPSSTMEASEPYSGHHTLPRPAGPVTSPHTSPEHHLLSSSGRHRDGLHQVQQNQDSQHHNIQYEPDSPGESYGQPARHGQGRHNLQVQPFAPDAPYSSDAPYAQGEQHPQGALYDGAELGELDARCYDYQQGHDQVRHPYIENPPHSETVPPGAVPAPRRYQQGFPDQIYPPENVYHRPQGEYQSLPLQQVPPSSLPQSPPPQAQPVPAPDRVLSRPIAAPPGSPPGSLHRQNIPLSELLDQSHAGNNTKPKGKGVLEGRESKRLHSKADPMMAMNEAEPSAVAARHTECLYTPLSGIEHRDTMGNVITEPDKSNPTRSRWERPLETIRSFERAIEAEHSKRRSIFLMGTDAGSVAAGDRSSNYFGQDGRLSRPSVYDEYRTSFRPEITQFELGPPARRRNYSGDRSGGRSPGPRWGPGPSRQRAPRAFGENRFQPGPDRNPQGWPHRDRSYETVTSAAPSATFEQTGYQTDPMSDNSSIERPTPVPGTSKPPPNNYGIGLSKPPEPLVATSAGGQPSTGEALRLSPLGQAPPMVPPREVKEAPGNRLSLLRRVSTVASQDGDKKKSSWLKRRFSRKG